MPYSREGRVSKTGVLKVKAPPFTDSWHPYSHRDVVDVMDKAVKKELGLQVNKEQYSLSNNENKMVGVWTIQDERKRKTKSNTIITPDTRIRGLQPTIIFQNSIDKSRSFALNVGVDDPVCTNLDMRADFLEFRKHTGRLDKEELLSIALRGAGKVVMKFKKALQFHRALDNTRITNEQAESVAYQLVTKGIVSQAKIMPFHNSLFGEDASYNPNKLFGVHSAATETMRDMNMTAWVYKDKQTNLRNYMYEQFPDLPQVNW